jgi:hypothetical protein
MTREREGRLNLRLNKAMLKQIKAYAKKRHLTLTTLVEQHFLKLLEDEKPVVDAEQV